MQVVPGEVAGVTEIDMNEDALIACVDLVGRAGASGFDIGYLHDDVPVEQAGWWAAAYYQGARIQVDDHQSPTLAAQALAERLLRGATCRCGQLVALSGGRDGCRWRLVGAKWEPGCDAPAVKVEGRRGDLSAMEAAIGTRRERRAKQRGRRA